jgi:hypothetical protein
VVLSPLPIIMLIVLFKYHHPHPCLISSSGAAGVLLLLSKMIIAELLYLLHGFIITGVAVPLAADVSYLLECVYDNQPGIRILPEKRIELTVKSAAHLVCIYGAIWKDIKRSPETLIYQHFGALITTPVR